MPRKIIAKNGVEKCPNCGNDKEFTIHSNQIMEDCCEVWAECKCGYKGNAFEDVWGGCSEENCRMAMHCWNDKIKNI